MSTDYPLVTLADGTGLELSESSSRLTLMDIPNGNWRRGDRTVGFEYLIDPMTPDEVTTMAIEMLKVVSYVDPNALKRAAASIGAKPDWAYYHEVLRGLL